MSGFFFADKKKEMDANEDWVFVNDMRRPLPPLPVKKFKIIEQYEKKKPVVVPWDAAKKPKKKKGAGKVGNLIKKFSDLSII